MLRHSLNSRLCFHKMAQSLAWTSSLGEAYHNQQADVMTAVQTLRAQAKKAGNLKSGPQITVVQQSPRPSLSSPPIRRSSMFRNTTRQSLRHAIITPG